MGVGEGKLNLACGQKAVMWKGNATEAKLKGPGYARPQSAIVSRTQQR